MERDHEPQAPGEPPPGDGHRVPPPDAPPARRSRRSTLGEGGGIGAPGSAFEDFLLQRAGLTLLVLVLAAYKIISTGHVSARVVNGEPPTYGVEEVPGIVWRFVHDPLSPGSAFEPVNQGGAVPDGLGYWVTFAVLLALHIGVGMLVYRWFQARRERERRHEDLSRLPERQRWAEEHEFEDLLRNPAVETTDGQGVVVGTHGSKHVTLEKLHSLILLGPPRSAKIGAVSVPALLTWDGPALVASNRGRTLDETVEWRRTQGKVRVFDPGATTRYERSGWALLSSCGHWEGAIQMAQHLTSAAYGSAGGRIAGGSPERLDRGSLWGGAMAMALAPYLYAGGATGRTILQVADWIEREEQDEVLDILVRMESPAAQALETAFRRPDESRSTFFHHMYQLLGVYGDPMVAASATKNDIVPEDLLKGRSNTLYLTAPEHDQDRFQPLFATIVRQTLAAANNQYMATGKPLDPPLLVVVDGAVGVASIQLLAQMSSTGAEKGVEVLSIFNDADWFNAVEGSATETLITNHRALMVLHRGSMGDSVTPEAETWAEIGGDLEPGEAALFYEDRRPIRMGVRRWPEDDRLRKRVEDPSAVLPEERRRAMANPSPTDDRPDYVLIDQTSAWRRRKSAPDHGDGDGDGSPIVSGGRRRRGVNVFRDWGDDPDPDPDHGDNRSAPGMRRGYRPDDDR